MPSIACTCYHLSHQLVEQTQVVLVLRLRAGTTAPTDSAPQKLFTGPLRGTLGQGDVETAQPKAQSPLLSPVCILPPLSVKLLYNLVNISVLVIYFTLSLLPLNTFYFTLI